MTANYLVHILHRPVRHLDFASVDDRSKNIVLGKVVNNLEKFLSNVGFNIQGKGRIEPDNLSSSRPVLLWRLGGRGWLIFHLITVACIRDSFLKSSSNHINLRSGTKMKLG